MDCAEEVSLLRARLSRERGVRDLQFDTFHARMTVEFDSASTSPSLIEAAVRETGMDCSPWTAQPEPPPRTVWNLARISTWISGLSLLAGLAFQAAESGELLSTLLAHGHDPGHSGPHAHHIPAFSLACYSLAILAGLHRIAPRAWASLRHLRPDMNLLVAASAAGAAGLGEWVEAASLSFLFSLAGRLESWSMERAREAIRTLLHVVPERATVVAGDHEHETSVCLVPTGALVRVAPGARIPFDGIVASGDSFVDQALITGESVAVPKGPGASVYAGTLNGAGALLIRTTREARDTVLSRLLRMVESSTHRKARSEQWIERGARLYTQTVLSIAISLVLFLPLAQGASWQQAAYAGMMVLLIACPCALVLSAPITMMAAITSAARQGALIKGGAFLEEAARLKLVLSRLPARLPAGIALQSVAATLSGGARRQLVATSLLDEPHTAYLGADPEDVEALQAARIGISIAGDSSDAAQEAADIVLMTPGVANLEFLIAHARRALQIATGNVALAIGLKLLFVAAALSGRATLWMAVASDMGATLLVTANALRLLRVSTPVGAPSPAPGTIVE